MIFENNLNTNCIITNAKSGNKTDVLKEIADLAKNNPALKKYSAKDIFNALEKREGIGTTGFGEGIAIPHCMLDNLKKFVLGILISQEGINFKSMDGKKTNIFFFIIGPTKERNLHIKILSSISKLLKSEEIKNKFIEAKDAVEIKEHIINYIHFIEETGKESIKEKCLFYVFIQDEENFNNILQIFSEAVTDGSVSVIETNNAGYYLNTMPLFAAYWNDDKRSFNRVILAVMDKALSNDVIRTIHMLDKNVGKEPGVLIAVHDLFYSTGSINF